MKNHIQYIQKISIQQEHYAKPKTEKTVPFGTVLKVENSYEIKINTQKISSYSSHKRGVNIKQRNEIKNRNTKNSEKNMCFRKKRLSSHTTTGLKANLQNIPRYVISYHVVCFG